MMPAYIKYQWKSHFLRRHRLRTIGSYLILYIGHQFLGALGRRSRYNNMDDMMRKKSITLTMLRDIYHHFRDCLIHLLVMRSPPLFRQLDLRNLHAELSLKLRRSKNRKRRRRRRRKQDRTMKWFHLIYL